ncbi:hypothetical protein B0H17DRAFT_1326830 [Mycena rosella]|uniref:RRM domain-containing protein n=1 Tax=Mycena rosella TaxID=1033263 RepID=A0AAD7GRN3_MYCRO|nr:hypothetical protein B0H17DRAFT_1326830 [Mycena rosella]
MASRLLLSLPTTVVWTRCPPSPEFNLIDKVPVQRRKRSLLCSRVPLPGLHPPVPLALSPCPPTSPPTPLPPPAALPGLVKHLPQVYTDSELYDIFCPFGALASARTPTHFGIDTGMVEFWNEDDARQAEESMHCADVQGHNISVQVYQPRRTSGGAVAEFNTSAPSFVPSGSMHGYPQAPASQYSPPRGSPYRSSVQPVASFVHGPGQQVQLAPITGPGSSSHSGLIDPCNLFCKNLDPDIDSNGLFTHFRQFGQIRPALHAMNGVLLGKKQVVVRLHEPKQLRQEKLAQRFGHNGHPRNSSGATSPTASEGGEILAGWSPRHHTSTLGSPVQSHYERPERGRRGSGSHYNAALSGTLNLPMRYDDLYALSPVVRQEVLTGELSRRVKALGSAPTDDVDAIVKSLVTISLSDVVQCIEDPAKLSDQVNAIRHSLCPSKQSSPRKSPSPSASQDSRLLDPNSLNATASAPEHPSTPISINASLSTPPRTSSPSGSAPPTSEREHILAAISKLETTRQAELTELLMSLSKRERATCLFNVEVLCAKLADANMVLDSTDDADVKRARARGGRRALWPIVLAVYILPLVLVNHGSLFLSSVDAPPRLRPFEDDEESFAQASLLSVFHRYKDLRENPRMPQCNHGNILITSRNPGLRVYANSHSAVSDMEELDAVNLLLRSAA